MASSFPAKNWVVEFFFNWGGTGGGGPGGGCLMTTDEPVPETHGGLEAGTVIKDQTACDVLTTILYPYQAPAFTSFYIENQATTLEIGQIVAGGDRTFRWSTSNSTNVQPNSIEITDVTAGGVVLGSGLADDGVEVLNIGEDKVQTAPNATYTWRISGINTKNQTFTRDFVVRWLAQVYWGSSVNPSLTADEIKTLENKQLKTGYAGNYNFPNDTGDPLYYYIAYPASFGTYSSWKDNDSGFEVDATDLGTIDITNDYGVTLSYQVYRTTYQQTAALNSTMS